VSRRTALEVRHELALELLHTGQLGPEEALCAVVWPRNERLAGDGYTERRHEWPPETAAEARRLYDEEGLTYPEIAQRLGVRFTTVKSWLNSRGRRRAAA
jgi:Sigma-70, region 4